MKKLLYSLVVFIILLVSFSMPLEALKPTADGISLIDTKRVTNDLKVAETRSFDDRDPIPITPEDYARIEWHKRGWSDSDWNALVKLWGNESHWNTNAVNKSSGACGIVQAYPCSKLGSNWRDPKTQIVWGINYIASRYGNPTHALAVWYSHCPSKQKCWY